MQIPELSCSIKSICLPLQKLHNIIYNKPVFVHYLSSGPVATSLRTTQARHFLRFRVITPIDRRAQKIQKHWRDLCAGGLVTSRFNQQNFPLWYLKNSRQQQKKTVNNWKKYKTLIGRVSGSDRSLVYTYYKNR